LAIDALMRMSKYHVMFSCRAGLGTVESALQLLSAESPFLQKAGAQRLSAIAALSDAGALSAIEGEAVPKLLNLLRQTKDVGGCRDIRL